jgi:hypothetical protein
LAHAGQQVTGENTNTFWCYGENTNINSRFFLGISVNFPAYAKPQGYGTEIAANSIG